MTWSQIIYVWVEISLTTIIQPLIVLRLSLVSWFDNSNLVSAIVSGDQKYKVMDFFVCCKKIVLKNTTNEQIPYLWENQGSVTI